MSTPEAVYEAGLNSEGTQFPAVSARLSTDWRYMQCMGNTTRSCQVLLHLLSVLKLVQKYAQALIKMQHLCTSQLWNGKSLCFIFPEVGNLQL